MTSRTTLSSGDPFARRPARRHADRASLRILVGGLLVVGLAVHLYVTLRPPADAFMWDHHEYISWGRLMDQDGLTALYDRVPPPGPVWEPRKYERAAARHQSPHYCNYPPGIAYVLYPKIKLLSVLDPTQASNTPIARLIFSGLPILCDVAMAFGCLSLVRAFGARAAVVAFGAAILAPPIILDTCTWGQTDSLILACTVWMLRAMQRKRWLTAGLLWGAALAVKTQGILLGPLWLAALVVTPRRGRIVAGMAVSGAVLFTAALPFTLHSGFAWFRHGFLTNLTEFYQQTTLLAFNVWYVDLLICGSKDAMRTWMGLSKDTWGKVFLLFGLAVTAVLIWRYRARRPDALTRFATVLMLLVVMLPTRVHERYIVLTLPLLICAAAIRPRVWWGLAPLLLAATFQITAPHWLTKPASQWAALEQDILQDIERHYAMLRQLAEQGEMPSEQFAALPSPREQLAIDRENDRKERWATGDPIREWALTLASLLSSLVCLVFVIPGCRARPPAAQPQ